LHTFCGLDECKSQPDIAFMHLLDSIPGDAPLVMGYIDAINAKISGDGNAEPPISGKSGSSLEDIISQQIAQYPQACGECTCSQDLKGLPFSLFPGCMFRLDRFSGWH
jgi:hypothetical protein